MDRGRYETRRVRNPEPTSHPPAACHSGGPAEVALLTSQRPSGPAPVLPIKDPQSAGVMVLQFSIRDKRYIAPELDQLNDSKHVVRLIGWPLVNKSCSKRAALGNREEGMVLYSRTKHTVASLQHEIDRGTQGSVHEVAEWVAIAVDIPG